MYLDLEEDPAAGKNTAPAEAAKIIEFVQENRDKKIGIITPFTNQRDCINQKLRENGIEDIQCGTVHAFQGCLLYTSVRKINRIMKGLKEKGIIVRVGSDRKGYWEIQDKAYLNSKEH